MPILFSIDRRCETFRCTPLHNITGTRLAKTKKKERKVEKCEMITGFLAFDATGQWKKKVDGWRQSHASIIVCDMTARRSPNDKCASIERWRRSTTFGLLVFETLNARTARIIKILFSAYFFFSSLSLSRYLTVAIPSSPHHSNRLSLVAGHHDPVQPAKECAICAHAVTVVTTPPPSLFLVRGTGATLSTLKNMRAAQPIRFYRFF